MRAQSCSTLCDPMECSLPGSSVHGILQARILEWVAISFSNYYKKITLILIILLVYGFSSGHVWMLVLDCEES